MNRLLVFGFLLSSILLTDGALTAQGDSIVNIQNKHDQRLRDFRLSLHAGIQVWSTYTLNTQVYNDSTGQYEQIDGLFNTQVRRSNFSIKGKAFNRLAFNFMGAMDFIGRDVLSGTTGATNNGNPRLRVWNAYAQWSLFEGNQKAILTAGYFSPVVGRESNTSGSSVSSMEKTWSQNYIRRHLVNSGPGRTSGLNLGGLLLNSDKKVNVRYDVGIHTPGFYEYSGNSQGAYASPLFTGRIELLLGKDKPSNYSYFHKANNLKEENLIRIAVVGSHQGESTVFTSNRSAGFDGQIKVGNLLIDGEWTLMFRDGETEFDVAQPVENTSGTGYCRVGYNIRLKNGRILEPSAAWFGFRGAMKAADQTSAILVQSDYGEMDGFDVGVNWIFNPNIKWSLHYTMNSGKLGDAPNGSFANTHFSQSGVALQRGDWIGMGVYVVL